MAHLWYPVSNQEVGSGAYGRTMGGSGVVDSGAEQTHGWARTALAGQSGGTRWHPVDTEDRGPLAGFAGSVSAVPDLPSPVPAVGTCWGIRAPTQRSGRGCTDSWRAGFVRVLHRWDLRDGQKGGCGVGATKRGKGSKIMAVADRAGLPLAVYVAAASPHEVTLVEATLAARFVHQLPGRLIGDKAYDSDPLDEQLRRQGIELIAPHKSNRVKPSTQDGRPLRRYQRRWKIERLFSWFNSFRRLNVRYDYHLDNFLGFLHLTCTLILLKTYL